MRTRHLMKVIAPGGLAAILAVAVALVPATSVGALSPSAHDRATAEAHKDLLHLADLPTGWHKGSPTTTTATGGTSTADTATTGTVGIAAAAHCEGVSVSPLELTVPTAQEQFTNTAKLQFLFEFVAVFPSAKLATQAFALFAGAKAPTCIGPEFAKEIAQTSSKTSPITASEVHTSRSSAPHVGAQSAGLLIKMPLTANGTKVELDLQLMVVRQGKVFAMVMPATVGALPPTSLVHLVATKAASRLK